MNKPDLVLVNDCFKILEQFNVLDKKSKEKIMNKALDLYEKEYMLKEFNKLHELKMEIFFKEEK